MRCLRRQPKTGKQPTTISLPRDPVVVTLAIGMTIHALLGLAIEIVRAGCSAPGILQRDIKPANFSLAYGCAAAGDRAEAKALLHELHERARQATFIPPDWRLFAVHSATWIARWMN
jgi:hypothetical protein